MKPLNVIELLRCAHSSSRNCPISSSLLKLPNDVKNWKPLRKNNHIVQVTQGIINKIPIKPESTPIINYNLIGSAYKLHAN